MQTGTMIFDVARLVSYPGAFMTLHPGDLIATGTSPGVGMGIKPAPVFLKSGDAVRIGIDGPGGQRQDVVSWNTGRAACRRPAARLRSWTGGGAC